MRFYTIGYFYNPGASDLVKLKLGGENNFQMVVRGYLSPDELENPMGKRKILSWLTDHI